ncbi:flagellar basal body rod protein FlgG [Virgibacillus sp. MSP4-1]|uniref:flagellar basal body rod protein FlgG n=1 Tax=Virgibacillus sp. MSP4-1 TaxID=2700081 RepID=UPI0003A6FC5E|nr:flagellar basal body rod protein FlgG [Virgibacillus sp. MSP4-1]QHS22253.1 flagellar basal body rod protein FlgG [Virgibacillus sp. MSP4-1]
MLRSMYAGISGMKGFQTKLDVIGNNIANVNTYGFKKGRMTFQDLMSQTVQGAQAPQVDENGDPVMGGKNPMQVGLGSTNGSIDTIHTQGSRQTTNRALDLALEGDGMFVVAEKTASPGAQDTISLQNDNVNFTRAGNFYLDDDGYIVNANGQYLVGRSQLDNDPDNNTPDDTITYPNSKDGLGENTTRLKIPKDAQSFSIGGDGTVNIVNANGQAQVAGQIMLAKFSNQGGLEKVGSNNYQLTNNAGVYTDDGNFDGFADLLVPGQDGSGSIYAGALEMSNVDLSEEFTEMITAQRGFQANTRIITTSDEILQELVNLKR